MTTRHLTKLIGPSLFLAAIALCTAGLFLAPATAEDVEASAAPAEVVPLADMRMEIHMEDGLVVTAQTERDGRSILVALTVENPTDADRTLVSELIYETIENNPGRRMPPMAQLVGSDDVELSVPAGETVTQMFTYPLEYDEESDNPIEALMASVNMRFGGDELSKFYLCSVDLSAGQTLDELMNELQELEETRNDETPNGSVPMDPTTR